MKRIRFAAVLAAVLLVLNAMVCTSFAADTPQCMTVLGDSIATGYALPGYAGDASVPADSFGNRLARDYGLVWGETYYNFAVDGMTSAGLLELLTADNDYSAAVRTAVAMSDTVIVSIGGNDLLMPLAAMIQSSGLELTAENAQQEIMASIPAMLTNETMVATLNNAAVGYAANMTAILSAVRAANPGARVFLIGLYNLFSGVPGMEGLAEYTGTLIDAMYSAASAVFAADPGAVALYTNEYFAGNAATLTNILAADVHPSILGHGVIHDLLAGVIETPAAVAVPTGDAPAASPATADASLAALTLAVAAAALLLFVRRGACRRNG